MTCLRPRLGKWLQPSPSLLAALLAGLLLPDWADAHALRAECRLQGSQVEVEVFFDSDLPAGNALVTVLDESQQAVAEGRTDAAGRWSFPVPLPGSYQVKVDAGVGHRRTVRLVVPQAVATEAALATTASEGLPHWLGVGIGLTAIGLFWLGLRWLVRKRLGARD